MMQNDFSTWKQKNNQQLRELYVAYLKESGFEFDEWAMAMAPSFEEFCANLWDYYMQ